MIKRKKFIEERRRIRARFIDEFFELSEDDISKILELGKTKIIEETSTEHIQRYWLIIGEERYVVMFSRTGSTSISY